MNINKQTLKAFRNDFATTVKALEEQYGVSINLGNIRFDETQFTSKVTVTNNETATGEKVDLGKRDFELYCRRFGLQPEQFGHSFMQLGTKYTIVGLKPRSRKYPILCKSDSDGKTYKFPAERVDLLLSSAQLDGIKN